MKKIFSFYGAEIPLKPSRRLPYPPEGGYHSYLGLAWQKKGSVVQGPEIHFSLGHEGVLSVVHFDKKTRYLDTPIVACEYDRGAPENMEKIWEEALRFSNKISEQKLPLTDIDAADLRAICCRSAVHTVLKRLGYTPKLLLSHPLGLRGTQAPDLLDMDIEAPVSQGMR